MQGIVSDETDPFPNEKALNSIEIPISSSDRMFWDGLMNDKLFGRQNLYESKL
jgi:hypothetical protein